jgi:hypothetical protein
MKKLFILLFPGTILIIAAFLPAYSQMPAAISVEPANATVYDEITLTFDPAEACFENGSLAGLTSIAMHSGVTINGSAWQNVVVFNGSGANGQPPTLILNPDGTYSIIFTPYDFYGFAIGANVTQICAVFNNGTDWTQDGRDFQQGGTICMDFFIPILPGVSPVPGINSILPNTAQQGESVNVNIFGINTHFQTAGTVAWLSYTDDSIGFQSIYAVNDTLISAQLTIPVDAALGFWNVNIDNPLDGLMTLINGFEITDDSIPVYPFAITLTPANATAYDEVTLTLDARLSCPYGGLFDADSVLIHSGVTIGGNVWQYVVSFDGSGANGQVPELTYNGDTTWSLVFIPLEFYGVPAGTYVEAINCVFNGGSWTSGEGKNFDPDGNCIDFSIPLAYATGINKVNHNQIMVYPNPATHTLKMYSEFQIHYFEILNCQGITISSEIEISGNRAQADLSNLANGLYVLIIEDETGYRTAVKFSKNN